MRPYYELPGFEAVYLEDSWVLQILRAGDMLVFLVDLVLTPDHEAYAPPSEGEQYCYRKARVIFDGLRAFTWVSPGLRAARDSTGVKDLGSFDRLESQSQEFVVEGDFGVIKLKSYDPRIELT